MTGVEQDRDVRRARSDDTDEDAPVDDWDVTARPSPLARAFERATEPVRPWLTWFGPRRLVGGGLTIVLAVGVGWWLVRPAPPPTEARLPYADGVTSSTSVPTASTATTAPSSTQPAVVVVHVAGAVAAPGVVELPGGSRVADALGPAGGALPDADLAAVNLATLLADGQQVYVPTVGEDRPPAAAPPAAVPTSNGNPAGPLDLNRATAAELDELPGIGPATAQAIVAHRDANGPFASVEDLEAVRGIGPAKLDALRLLVTT